MRQSNSFTYKQFTITQDHAAMKVGTDSDLLGTLAEGGNHILDIGTGTGVLSLIMAQRNPEATVTAIEIDDNAIIDASANFQASPFADRITLIHTSFQDFLRARQSVQPKASDTTSSQPSELYDCVVCNPPYFDKSLESKDQSRTRARHTSSLPFSVLVRGAYSLLQPGGVFSVCLPPEVIEDFRAECIIAGFCSLRTYNIKTVPDRPAKRFILTFRKGWVESPETITCCMLTEARTRSEWYLDLMRDFHAWDK